MRGFVAAVLTMCVPAIALAQDKSGSSKEQDKQVRINQIQVIGTHNSYNMGFAPSEAKYVAEHDPKTFHGVEYHHQTLPQQLDGGVRQLELDIVQDPAGGRFAHPKIVELTKDAGLPADPDFDPNHDFLKPGFKTIHLGDINQRSACTLFTQCLRDIRNWSKAHPRHVPIFILIEDKQGKISTLPDAVTAEPWTAATWDAMDAEIRSVFKPGEIITPDDVRGRDATLEAAVLAGKWPTLKQARGKVVFLLYNRKSAPAYLAGHAMMKGRLLFVNGRPGEPEAGFVEQDKGTAAEIAALVKKGYLVRTRADYNTDQGRTNDTTRKDETLKSGAQMVSTDFPASEPAPWTGYTVALPGGLAARCNPVNAPAGCSDKLIEAKGK
ncbi:MAG: phosphatidylinositol-specific phospholipase C1-like protein [Edaphobacter sp.]|uniref:phosphatidylinositol-specific phospholipase C1-like protein n=1 Tax=Edaphobacter sp. TaxID=1934404 RepID=UPI0023A2E9E9|nr:phosphatidylinositol-specific phospholipase C1-like protein [Edaphobacter sp.]MDE1178772.1 phosphatidylinositol-specific phospholipase C1-like protein [Edaphobacter sp.]